MPELEKNMFTDEFLIAIQQLVLFEIAKYSLCLQLYSNYENGFKDTSNRDHKSKYINALISWSRLTGTILIKADRIKVYMYRYFGLSGILDVLLLTNSNTAHLTGHSLFEAYLFKFRRAPSSLCEYGDVALASYYFKNCSLIARSHIHSTTILTYNWLDNMLRLFLSKVKKVLYLFIWTLYFNPSRSQAPWIFLIHPLPFCWGQDFVLSGSDITLWYCLYHKYCFGYIHSSAGHAPNSVALIGGLSFCRILYFIRDQ